MEVRAAFLPVGAEEARRFGRDLRSPTHVRNAIRYVLLKARRHLRQATGVVPLDPASLARWFDGWKREASVLVREARTRPGGHLRAVARRDRPSP